MDIELTVVGKTTTPYLREGIELYEKRIRHYVPFRIVTLSDVRKGKSTGEEQQRDAEGKALLAGIGTADILVLFDERGREYSSIEYSTFIQKLMASGRKKAVFVIGGPYGFSEEVYRRADYKVSLSRMTFNHEMVRLFAAEQIYRAMTILRGEPYHHE